MKTNPIALMALVLSLSAVATSPVRADDETPQTAEAPKKKEPLICRSDRVLGSRTRVNRTCATQAEWDALAAKTSEVADKMQRNGSGAGSYGDATKDMGAMGGT